MLVNTGVVHQYHYLLVLRVPVGAKLVKSTMQEVVENNVVSAALCDLRRYDTVLG